jgi:ABC-type multidrug transport system fused ATPase/permease subunit
VIDGTSMDHLWKDAGWRGALTILLGSPQLATDGRVWQHIDLKNREIHFDKMLGDATFSSGERTLIEVAASLFSNDVKVNLWEAISRLDDRSARLVVAAICNFAHIRDLRNPFPHRSLRNPKGKARER